MRTSDILPCSSSISIQSCYSLPNIQLILFPHLPPPPFATTVHPHPPQLSIYDIESSGKKRYGLHEGVEAIIHFRATVFPLPGRPMFPCVIYDTECSYISKITITAGKIYLQDLMPSAYHSSQYVTVFMFFGEKKKNGMKSAHFVYIQIYLQNE